MEKTLAASGRVAGALLGAAVAGGTAVGAYAIGLERLAFGVRHETVRILPPGARPIAVLHLADIHLAPWQHRKREWLRHLTDLEPDLVINTGDSLGHRDALPALETTLDAFRGVPGVFVHGSNDYFGPVFKNPLRYLGFPGLGKVESNAALDITRLESFYAGLGWLDLNNAARAIELKGTRLELFGVDDAHIGKARLDALPDAIRQMREHVAWSPKSAPATVAIGVTHSPYRRVLDALVDAGADAIFAGHTHGGQIRVPGGHAIVTNCDIPREQASGLSAWRHGRHEALLNVSSGIGTSIFAPFRLGTPPEAVLVSLEPRD